MLGQVVRLLYLYLSGGCNNLFFVSLNQEFHCPNCDLVVVGEKVDNMAKQLFKEYDSLTHTNRA